MGLRFRWLAVVLLFVVPLALWIVCTAFTKRRGFAARALAFVAGSDNRLSLSRLQAFAWTLMIYGSYLAAMAYHAPLRISGTAEAKLAVDSATALDSAASLRRAAFIGRIYANDGPGAEAAAKEAASYARRAVSAAKEAGNFQWVGVPGTLLMLAGLAIGTGVLSSVIAQVGKAERPPCISAIGVISADDPSLAMTYPGFTPSLAPYCLEIRGTGLSAPGSVRVNGVTSHIPYWKDDGTVIIAELPTAGPFTRLVVDTAGGKLAYALTTVDQRLAGRAGVNAASVAALTQASLATATSQAVASSGAALVGTQAVPPSPAPALLLGEFFYDYEWSDLFREDSSPSSFSLMKFQMFGWTVIAISLYMIHFIQNLTPSMMTLPTLDQSLVILTGVSQIGYLSGKAIGATSK
jgi:hypothetical protein